jgi:hypothetical protein
MNTGVRRIVAYLEPVNEAERTDGQRRVWQSRLAGAEMV